MLSALGSRKIITSYMGSVGPAWGLCDHVERQLQQPKKMFKPFLMGSAETIEATESGACLLLG